jgi:hypothetical protein
LIGFGVFPSRCGLARRARPGCRRERARACRR